jgi:hypothetical protein
VAWTFFCNERWRSTFDWVYRMPKRPRNRIHSKISLFRIETPGCTPTRNCLFLRNRSSTGQSFYSPIREFHSGREARVHIGDYLVITKEQLVITRDQELDYGRHLLKPLCCLYASAIDCHPSPHSFGGRDGLWEMAPGTAVGISAHSSIARGDFATCCAMIVVF